MERITPDGIARTLASTLLLLSLSLPLPAAAEDGPAVPAGGAPAAAIPAAQPPPPGGAPDCPLPEKKTAESEFVWELDPYYSEISLHIPLTDEPIPEFADVGEFEVYRKLFADSLKPRFMLVEAAVFPMPLTGVALKRYAPDFYRGFNVGTSDLNLLQSVTAGFQEPYAFSLFLGDMVSFVRPGEEKVCSNKGYMGYMLSYSNQHIKRNVLIPDHNLEAEWKAKGDRIFKEDKLSWSFRIGAKVHQNPDITNTVYLGFRRNHLDFRAGFLGFLSNSDLNIRWDFSARDGRLLRQEYVFGKKYPIKSWRVAFKMEVGVIWEDPAIYTGPLHDKDFQNVTAVLRPNIEF